MSQPFHIAIDGPVAAGKGTISRLVADRLQFLYVDTGAMYRVVALLSQRNNVEPTEESAVVPLLEDAHIDMHNPEGAEKDGRLTTVFLNGEDVSWAIRTEQVGLGSSKVAAHPEVRRVLVKKQQIIAENKDVVMEGRDITYRVLPNSQLKIFLTANDTVRAKRRHLQLLLKGTDIPFQEVYSDLLKRDKQDTTRSVDPLTITPESWVIDTSDLSIEQVVALIVAKVKVLK